MKKVTARSVGKLLMTLIALVALGVAGTHTFADPGPTMVSIDPEFSREYRVVPDTGETFDVTVRIEDAVDLGGYEFKIDFDPSIVQVVNVEDGGFLGSTGRTVTELGPDIENGTITFGAVSTGDQPGPNGDGTLATITLRAIGIGDSPLDLHDVRVFNTAAEEEEIPNPGDGTVTSIVEVSIAPAEKSVNLGITGETVNVMIRGALDLGDYEFKMDFDPDVVEVTNVEDGGFLGSTGRTVIPVGPDIGNGTLTFGAVSLGDQPGPNGEGILATITFNAVGLGGSRLDLHDIKLSNTAAEKETPNVVLDGTLFVQRPAYLEVTDVSSDLTDNTASVGQTFHITATVHNAGEAVAEDVSASMVQTGGLGSATCTAPTVVSGDPSAVAYCEEVVFEWECTCTGAGDVVFTVTPSGVDENTGEPIPSENIDIGTITIHQEEVAFRIYLPLIMKNYIP